MKGQKGHILFILLFLVPEGIGAQDPVYSQFYANPLYLNPALAGSEGPVRFSLGVRNQWPGATDPYVTYHASYDQYVEALHGGIGLHVINDRQGAGVLNRLSIDAIYAYHLQVSRALSLSGGFQMSIGHRNRKVDGLVLPSQLYSMAGNDLYGYSELYPDFAVGFAGFYKLFYGGLAAHHLTEPTPRQQDNPQMRLARKYTAHLGALIPVFERRMGTELLTLSPNLVFIQQDIYQQLNYGLEMDFRGFMAGFWFRQDLLFSFGTLIFSAGYGNERFRLRYTYDVKLSPPDLLVPNLGSHELSMVILLENSRKSALRGAIKSPKI